MIVRLSDIEERLVVKGEMTESVFENLAEKQFALKGPIVFNLVMNKYGERVRITGPIRATFKLSCSRCLEEFFWAIDTRLDVELARRENVPQASEVELKPDDLDVYYYESDEIDLDPIIYDEMLLGLPSMPLCKEGCAGLCPSCGRNKNVEPCSCIEPVTSALGEKLKSFLNK